MATPIATAPATTSRRGGALRVRWRRESWRARERAILAAGRALVTEGLVVGTVGNVSARHRGELRITPTRTAYETMRRRDLVRVDAASGRPLTAAAAPSRELPLHLAVYRARPDVAAVVHTHSPYATAWSFLDLPLEPEVEDLDYYGIGAIRTAAPAPPGSDELAYNVSRALGNSNAVLLADHGVLTTGCSVDNALLAARVVEQQARIAWMVRAAGAPSRG